VLKKTNVYENCPESNTMQDNPVTTLRITFKYVISSPVPMPFFHTFLPLAPSFNFGACITFGWVKIFEGQVENNQENTSTSDQTNIKWYYRHALQNISPVESLLDFKIQTS
jgi:hypothetical protein